MEKWRVNINISRNNLGPLKYKSTMYLFSFCHKYNTWELCKYLHKSSDNMATIGRDGRNMAPIGRDSRNMAPIGRDSRNMAPIGGHGL